MPAPQYDVFLSYNWRDRTAVEAVARTLKERGLSVFLDRWYLAPGQSWPRALEKALDGCDAVAVFVGPHGMGRWQQREKNLALDRQARVPEFPVIPVLLPDADPALGFLSLNTWIDLRDGLDDMSSISVLTAAVRGLPSLPHFIANSIRFTVANLFNGRTLTSSSRAEPPRVPQGYNRCSDVSYCGASVLDSTSSPSLAFTRHSYLKSGTPLDRVSIVHPVLPMHHET